MSKGVLVLSAMLAIAVGASANTWAAPADNGTGVEFAHPDRIRYDNRSLIINGKPVFLYSGAFHYFRCPKELWKDRLTKLKEAGLNCVETYLAWDVHEPEEPANPQDFSKLRQMEDIAEFIQTAQDLGLYVIIRPGPYICAEWDRGALPGWLMKHRPEGVKPSQFLRGNTPEMLAWDRHWIEAAAKVVKRHLMTNVPAGSTGVILWQLENEYDLNGAQLPSEMRADVLRALAHAAIDNGIDVPLFTCLTKDQAFRDDPFLRSHVYDTTNRYPSFNMNELIQGIDETAKYQPEKFRAITELQGGWFAQVGGKLSDQQGHNAAQINQLTLTAIEHGVTSMNYYMFYGGANLGYGAAKDLIQSYDYNAPLREPGGEGDRYFAVKAIASMLQEHGEQLIDSDSVDVTVTGEHPDVSVTLRKSRDGSRFYFFRNSRRNGNRAGSVEVEPKAGGQKIAADYDLGPFGAKVLYLAPDVNDAAKGEWLPKSLEAPAAATPVPEAVAVSVKSIVPEEPADKWVDVAEGKPLDSVNIHDQRYVHYRANFDLSASEMKAPLGLRVQAVGGGKTLTGRINGKEIVAPAGPARSAVLPLAGVAHEGQNTVEILFENLGVPNFGPGIEEEEGITQVSVIPMIAAKEAVDDWRMKVVRGEGEMPAEVAADYDDRSWKPVRVDGEATIRTPETTAVYRGTLNVTGEQIAAGLPITFGSIDDLGTIYVNGTKVGTTDSWSHPWTFDVAKFVHEGKNSIAVVVRNEGRDGGLYGGCTIEPKGRDLSHLQVSAETEVPANAGAVTGSRQLLSRYTLQFTMPPASTSMFVPWKLHLDADANAFVTFNGHLLGRYWAVGPQRDFWLPECWLKSGETNEVVLQVRPTSDAPADAIIKSVRVEPYAQFAIPLDRAQ